MRPDRAGAFADRVELGPVGKGDRRKRVVRVHRRPVVGGPPVIVPICPKSDQILKCTVAAVKVNRYRGIRNLTLDEAG